MSDDDPFADLDPDKEREGDPFEDLGTPSEGDESTETDEEDEILSSDVSSSGIDSNQISDARRLSDALDEKKPDDNTPDFDAPTKEEFFEEVDEDEIAAAVEQELGQAQEVPDDVDVLGEDADDQQEDDPFAEIEDQAEGMAGGIQDQDEEDILEALGDQDGDPFDDEELFTEAEVTTVDANRVWDSLDEDESFERSATEIQEDVSKHRFCKQCEYFSGPPASHCTHETAEITQYLDMDTVRVLNCPVVARERQIENE
jgi:hypothetical protein